MIYPLKQILLPFERTYQNVIVDTTEGSKGLSTLVNALVISPSHRSLVPDLVDVLNENFEIESDVIIEKLIDIAQFFNQQNNVNSDFLRSTLNQFITEKTQLDPVFNGMFKAQANGDILINIELSIFQLYQLSVVHMWVSDNPTVASKSLKDTQQLIIEGYSLNKSAKTDKTLLDIQENKDKLQDYSIIKSFLASTATQLTELGLGLAQNKLQPKDVVVFYKNEQFQTLLKNDDGVLYILAPILDSELNWRSLKSINGTNDDYLNSLYGIEAANFNTIDDQQQLSDEELARQLQIKEDAKYAAIVNDREYESGKQRTNNQNYIAKKQAKIKENKKKSKKKTKKCVIM